MGKLAQRWERVGVGFDILRLWIGQAWRIGILMAKGAYLLAERKRFFLKLGEETYQKFLRGELRDSDLEPTIKQVDRLTKKVEIEEMLIQNLRFGGKATRPPPEDPVSSEPSEPNHINEEL